MIYIHLFSVSQKTSLSNEYNKLSSHHFKDPVRWGVNVTPITKRSYTLAL